MVCMWVLDTLSFSLEHTHITDWETTLLGYQVELEWRLKVFPSASNLWFWISLLQSTLSFLYSKTYITHVINCEWSRSVNFPQRMFCMRYKHIFFLHTHDVVWWRMASNWVGVVVVAAEFEFELGWLNGQRNELSLLLLLILGGG